jgi:uncharacterized damage-inducible protein DinB
MPGNVPQLDDERELLLAYVAQQRDALRNAAYGLTDDQARATPTPSGLSVGGLVKHIAAMERSWMDTVMQRPPRAEAESDYEAGFRLGADETLADALAELAAAGEETEATIRGVALDDPVPVPKDVPWFPDDVDAWSVRWVVLHLIEEIARHAGHADIVREGVDGATAFPLMAAVEGWPATPWMQPWEPRTASS